MDHFEEDNKIFVYILFILATFLTGIKVHDVIFIRYFQLRNPELINSIVSTTHLNVENGLISHRLRLGITHRDCHHHGHCHPGGGQHRW